MTAMPDGSRLGGIPALPAWPPVAAVAGRAAGLHRPDPPRIARRRRGVRLATRRHTLVLLDAQQRLWSPNPSHSGAWQVAWFPAGTPLELRSPPPDLEPEARFPEPLIDRGTRVDPTALGLARDSIVSACPRRSGKVATSPVTASRTSRSALPPLPSRVTGCSDTRTRLQGDIRWEAELDVARLERGPTASVVDAYDSAVPAPDWRLLLQVDSDESLGMQWGDAGSLYFLVRPDALESRTFVSDLARRAVLLSSSRRPITPRSTSVKSTHRTWERTWVSYDPPVTSAPHPRVFVSRALPEEGIDLVRAVADVDVWPDIRPPSRAEALAADRGLHRRPADAERARGRRVHGRGGAGAAGDLVVLGGLRALRHRSLPPPRDRLCGHTPGVLTETNADTAWALLMAAARRSPKPSATSAPTAGGRAAWTTCSAWTSTAPQPGSSVRACIGQAVARRASGFRMRVLYHSRHRGRLGDRGGARGDLGALRRAARRVRLRLVHVPLSPETRGLIDAAALARMKPDRHPREHGSRAHRRHRRSPCRARGGHDWGCRARRDRPRSRSRPITRSRSVTTA